MEPLVGEDGRIRQLKWAVHQPDTHLKADGKSPLLGVESTTHIAGFAELQDVDLSELPEPDYYVPERKDYEPPPGKLQASLDLTLTVLQVLDELGLREPLVKAGKKGLQRLWFSVRDTRDETRRALDLEIDLQFEKYRSELELLATDTKSDKPKKQKESGKEKAKKSEKPSVDLLPPEQSQETMTLDELLYWRTRAAALRAIGDHELERLRKVRVTDSTDDVSSLLADKEIAELEADVHRVLDSAPDIDIPSVFAIRMAAPQPVPVESPKALRGSSA